MTALHWRRTLLGWRALLWSICCRINQLQFSLDCGPLYLCASIVRPVSRTRLTQGTKRTRHTNIIKSIKPTITFLSISYPPKYSWNTWAKQFKVLGWSGNHISIFEIWLQSVKPRPSLIIAIQLNHQTDCEQQTLLDYTGVSFIWQHNTYSSAVDLYNQTADLWN